MLSWGVMQPNGSIPTEPELSALSSEDRFLAPIYDELRRLAAAKMAQEGPGHTLQPTALVHEAWLRLGGGNQPNWNSRAHFFGAAAEAMRRILVERARARQAQKRGGGAVHIEFESLEISGTAESEDILSVHEALEEFAREHPRHAELVKLRFFGGLLLKEAAILLDVSEPTAKRWWAYSRAWLFERIGRFGRLSSNSRQG
jgi:RNA polymerase sigma factor (TIGR02999 family)